MKINQHTLVLNSWHSQEQGSVGYDPDKWHKGQELEQGVESLVLLREQRSEEGAEAISLVPGEHAAS